MGENRTHCEFGKHLLYEQPHFYVSFFLCELSTENDFLMWGVRVVVPQSLHVHVLKTIHANHPGITRMKAIARSYFWWSGLDKAIEEMGKTCHTCQANQPNPPTAPLYPW